MKIKPGYLLPVMSLLLALTLACANQDNAAPAGSGAAGSQPEAAMRDGTMAGPAPVSAEAVAEFAAQQQALNDDWDGFHAAFDQWRSGLSACDRTAAEEALRVESPVRALFRTTTREVTLGGVALPKRTLLMLLFAAANRDECAFENAAQFDVERENAGDHLAFSWGAHYCIGAALARLEIRVAFEEVLRRMTNFRLDPAYPAPRHEPSYILRGLQELHILFDKVA